MQRKRSPAGNIYSTGVRRGWRRGKAGWVGMGEGKCGSPPELEQRFTARGHEEMNGEAGRAGWESAPGRTGKKDALFCFLGVHK